VPHMASRHHVSLAGLWQGGYLFVAAAKQSCCKQAGSTMKQPSYCRSMVLLRCVWRGMWQTGVLDFSGLSIWCQWTMEGTNSSQGAAAYKWQVLHLVAMCL